MARKGTVEAAKSQDQPPRSAQPSIQPSNRPETQATRGEVRSAAEDAADEDVSPDEIAARAYQIFERNGRADGNDMEHWLQAERELREERRNARTSPAQSAGMDSTGGSRTMRGAERGAEGTRPPRPDEAPRSARRHQSSMV